MDIFFQRHKIPGHHLEMKMVRGGSSAFRSVVEHRVAWKIESHVQQIFKVWTDLLRGMNLGGYCEMPVENGIWVYKYVVLISVGNTLLTCR